MVSSFEVYIASFTLQIAIARIMFSSIVNSDTGTLFELFSFLSSVICNKHNLKINL